MSPEQPFYYCQSITTYEDCIGFVLETAAGLKPRGPVTLALLAGAITRANVHPSIFS